MSHTTPESLAAAARRELDAILQRTTPMTPKERLAISAQVMPAQDPVVRRHNMQEVALGYTPEQARLESMR
ncbi:MAG: dihydropyrimidine dehydrogenase, partial [bacterium]